jgi:epoxyqueuosine reductase
MEKAELTQYIKSEALRLGFDICGIAKAEVVPDETIQLYNQWIAQEYHGTMQYLQRNCEKRFDPTRLVEGCKSIVVVALNYYPSHPIKGMASYAIGNDYHKIVKDKLYTLLNNINAVRPIKGRAFCDSAPVLERHWAVQAGIGWVGHNRQLTIPHKGSYFFIGELLIDAELEYDTPFTANHCGNCRKCLDNCPTGALSNDGFDAPKCLSYLTIEYRGELTENIGKKMGNNFYGCDCCLKACPHNRFSTPNSTTEFKPSDELQQMDIDKWKKLTKEQYNTLFAKSAVERCGYEQLMRNISAIKED